jgi:hypothetical protein
MSEVRHIRAFACVHFLLIKQPHYVTVTLAGVDSLVFRALVVLAERSAPEIEKPLAERHEIASAEHFNCGPTDL